MNLLFQAAGQAVRSSSKQDFAQTSQQRVEKHWVNSSLPGSLKNDKSHHQLYQFFGEHRMFSEPWRRRYPRLEEDMVQFSGGWTLAAHHEATKNIWNVGRNNQKNLGKNQGQNQLGLSIIA